MELRVHALRARKGRHEIIVEENSLLFGMRGGANRRRICGDVVAHRYRLHIRSDEHRHQSQQRFLESGEFNLILA
jgi:hypothetical protein